MATHRIAVSDGPAFDVEAGVKLVNALEDNGVDVSHRCGGLARCTTCRVTIDGDQPPMGEAEKVSLEEDGVLGQFRLSCQIRVESDLKVDVLMPVSTQSWENPGPTVAP